LRKRVFHSAFLSGPFYSHFILSILIVGFNIAVKLMFKSLRDEEMMKELERHNLQSELEYLKYQINPHFFMNTLNNIHALVDLDSEKAKTSILELSKMMRYVLYESSNKTVSLSREIKF
jgi:LytS/YehU family sensor histidine kinase